MVLKAKENWVFVGFERKEDLREKGGDFWQQWPKEWRDKDAIGMVFSGFGSEERKGRRKLERKSSERWKLYDYGPLSLVGKLGSGKQSI